MTNTTKAQIAAAVNAVLGVVAVFGIGTQEQIGAVGVALNAVIALVIALTYKDSPKRLPDGVTQADVAQTFNV